MPTYEQNKKAAEKYLATLDRITIRISKESGIKQSIQEHADAMNESVNTFILRAIAETMQRDKHPSKLDGEHQPLQYHLNNE